MNVTRRAFLTTGSMAAAVAAAPRAFAQWQPSQRYPDPAIQIIDQSFARYRINQTKVERLATGFRWSEGPAWFGDGRYVLWSDIPNNRIMCKSDGSIWFTDPPFGILGYYEGYVAKPELPTSSHVRSRPVSRTEYDGTITTVAERWDGKPLNSPNDIEGGQRLTNKRKFIDAGPGTPDGFRCDVDGNLWCGWGMGQEGLDGVAIYNPDGKLIGRINLPERCANLCFGGTYRNRLFMAASTSLYSLYVNTQGVLGG
jgi:sugar lactone lactonase YvrE